jgi:hypothetical protein
MIRHDPRSFIGQFARIRRRVRPDRGDSLIYEFFKLFAFQTDEFASIERRLVREFLRARVKVRPDQERLPGEGGFVDDRARSYYWARHVAFCAETFGDLVEGWQPIK